MVMPLCNTVVADILSFVVVVVAVVDDFLHDL